jgi:hypothetical protein
MRIELHTMDFVNDGVADDDDITWLITGLDGWDSPEQRQSSVEPTSRHGARLSSSMLAARALTLKGLTKAKTLAQYEASQAFLNGLLNNLWFDREMVVHEQTVKTIYVVRGGAVRMNQVGVLAYEWEMPLLANDPLKYGEEVTVSIPAAATRTLTNLGNFPTERIVATTGGTVILANGKTLRAEAAPASTVFDFWNRTIEKTGVSHFDKLLSTSEWWDLQPGANSVVNTGSATASVTFRPAWL